MKPRIAVFSGPCATIQNTPPLLTSSNTRRQYGLDDGDGQEEARRRFDALHPQRLAAPAVVYVEQFSAHPLERDASELYGPPDAYIDRNGAVHEDRTDASDRAVYRVELRPDDGLYLLPYAARQRSGAPWDDDSAPTRQTFYPDASRLYEEIDRFGVDHGGAVNSLSRLADYDYFRAMPSAGYTKGLEEARRTDRGDGDVQPERQGDTFFTYQAHRYTEDPHLRALAEGTSLVQQVLRDRRYAGAQWLESSATVAETLYWLNLLIDTDVPIVGQTAQRSNRTMSCDGPRNIVDGVRYIVSEAWRDAAGHDAIGAVLVVDELAFSARDVTKRDARPGGYTTSGGHGGIVADLGDAGPPAVTYVPCRKHTSSSEVRLSVLPDVVVGVTSTEGRIHDVSVQVKDQDEGLRPAAMPAVTIETWASYRAVDANADGDDEVGIAAWVSAHLAKHPLAGFVYAGSPPYGKTTQATEQALARAVFSGLPVVLSSVGNPGGRASPWQPYFITANNLAAPKARMLLMACLLKLGALPPARDARSPSAREIDRTSERVRAYQAIFDSH